MAGFGEVRAMRRRFNRGMNLWDRIGARLYDPFLWLGEHRGMERHRAELLEGARGRVLEIGAGTGLNLRHYPAAVGKLVLTQPLEAMGIAVERRAPRPGGGLLFIEHLRSEDERWGRWQDRLELPWKAFGDGCRCNRPTLELLGRSGLALGDVS